LNCNLRRPCTVARVNAALGEQGLDLVYWDYSSSSKHEYMSQLRKHEPLVSGNNTADGRRGLMMSLVGRCSLPPPRLLSSVETKI